MKKTGYLWQLQEAKNRLSQLVADASDKGPQTITVRGEPAVVVLSVDDYRRLARRGDSLVEFLKSSPLQWLPLERDRDTGRDIAL